MALEGAKLICLDADDNGEFETIVPKGKSFKFGYYMDCDVVLQHPDALGLQCVINCDAFGRVTIENRSTDQPITLDGKTLGKTRPLLHNTEICILDKKYLWQFEGNPELRGFQMEDVAEFTTPSKQVKKAQQPPNSEPARKWRRHFQNRLTIHSFAYCIKAGESPQDVKTTTDENKPLNIHEKTTDGEIEQNKIISPCPATVSDFVDSNTFKSRNVSLGVRNSPLSYCNLTETVITSYSPRETGIRQEKSFAVVQSPQATMEMRKTDVSLGPFHHTVLSPQVIQIHRPSMHLIDLTTPMKLMPSSSSPARTLLKSTLKKNLPQGISPRTPQKPKKTTDLSATGSSETVYSVRSTDDESVIVVSDDGSTSPSPIARTPPRGRTPQSLMKRAIISSAKKAERAAVSKKLLNLSGSKRTVLPVTPKIPNTVRFQSQSTPQRKSIARIPSSVESLSAGKPRKSLITSTPFRRGADTSAASSSRRSLTINSPSTSLGITKHESRNSLMLRQALAMTPTSTISNQKRKSVSSVQISHKPRKSVSFLQNVEKEDQTNVKESDVAPETELNRTFSIEEDEQKEIQCDQVINSNRNDGTISTEIEKCQEGDSLARKSIPHTKKVQEPEVGSEDPVDETSLQNNNDSVVLHKHINVESKNQTPFKKHIETKNASTIVSHLEIESNNPNLNEAEFQDEAIDNKHIDSQTPQSSKIRTELSESISNTSGKNSQNTDEDNDYEFEGLDEVFKTPKAKNLMILSSPKSISLQKRSSDSVELIHSTEFDLSANLDDLFQTPQSEFAIRRVDAEDTSSTSASCAALSPEEAFDMLVGRPSIKKSYARQKTPQKHQHSPLKMSNDPTLPKTDIEEWIDSVNESIEHLDGCQNEDEMSYLTTAMSEYSRDPLMMSSMAQSSTKKKTTEVINTPKDEFEMTLQEVDEADNNTNATVRKDPLEMTAPRPLSPNISGIDLLDHTSESIFSETLAVSDDSSLKEIEKTAKAVDLDNQDETTTPGNENLVKEAQEDKARREIEEAFENFEMERKTLEERRLVSTPEAKKPSISKLGLRRTMGNQVVSAVKLDLQAAKAERELELAFENFEEEPEFLEKRVVKTPEPNKTSLKDHRRTLGSALIPEVTLDLQAAKAERELELAFENFEEEPEFLEKRVVKTPEPNKTSLKDHRRTLGSALVPEVRLDLQSAKAERELEQAFENFEEDPGFLQNRVLKTPEPKKTSLKDHRRTLGSALVPEVKLDLQAAKAERELELAFENFEEEPEFLEKRVVKTPEPNKTSLKDHRRTLGSALIPEVTLDLQAAKAERELELAFENFEEEPEFLEKRVVKTPEPKKTSLKDHRRTLGSSLIPEVTLDLQAAKAERELELAFENFEDDPEFTEERLVKTPEPKKTSLKDHRRTLGSALVPEVKLDLQAAKAERELELAFENFEEDPEFAEERLVKTPEPKKQSLKDHRRTLGSALVPEVKLDLQAAKAERELELAFENFEDDPEFTEERLVKTPEPKKTSLKDHRRTLGSALVPEVKLDLQAAKAERELELAFENFEDDPEFTEERLAKTPESKKTSLKDHRRTLGSALVPEVKLDLQAAKAERELELAFEHFEDDPEFTEERLVKTPEPKKTSLKDHRRTLGSSLIPEVTLDLQAAKAERELEVAFENFEEAPEFAEKRLVKTPEPKKTSLKDHRRTLGSALVPEVKLDLQAAKAERELELAFENFEEDPEFAEERLVKTPEPKKQSLKEHRRTLGSALVPEVKLDLQAAKAERELELAFEHFEDDPEFTEERLVKTPEPKKQSLKDHRRTLGSALVPEIKLDLQAAKAERELELAFENFEEAPEFAEERLVKTPEPKKTSLKDHRRTLGSALIPEVTLDLQAAKAERELEVAFENFEEAPEFAEERLVKTPEPKKTSVKDHRRTLGSALVPEVTLDLQAAKAERELSLLSTHITSDQERKLQKESDLERENTFAEPEHQPEKFEPANNQKDDDAEKSEGNKVIALGTGNNIVEEQNEPKTTATENLTRTRRTRQHSADNVEKPSRPSRKTRKTSNSDDDEAIKITNSRLDSTDVDSTEDETSQTSHKSRKKRVLKKSSKTIEASAKDTELPCLLEPIVEEERNPDANFTNKELESKAVTSNEAEPVEMKTLSPVASKQVTQIRRTRQNSIDTPTDETKLNVQRMRKKTRQNSVDLSADDSKTQPISSRKASNVEDQAINNSSLQLDSTDVDSKSLKTSEASIKETEIQFENESKSVGSLKSKENDVVISSPLTSQNSRQIRKTRQKSVDTTADDLKKRGIVSKELSDDESLKITTPLRRTRQNSVDTTKDDGQKSAFLSSDVQTTAIIEEPSMKKSSNEGEEIKLTTSRLDSTDNYSTDDEASKTSRNLRPKRLRKTVSKVCETSLKETELHCVLEPIVEEEKNIETTIKNEELVTKSVITLKAEADEIVSLSPVASYSRIRGRRAKLNVVLLESKDTSSAETDKDAVNQVLDSVDDCSKEEYIENDIGESIPATPVLLNTRGRRPSKTLESSKLTVPISVQQNQIEETVSSSSKVTNSSIHVDENEEDNQYSPDASKTTEDSAPELKKITPTLQDDITDDVDHTTVVVEAPPLDITEADEKDKISSKARGRREAVKLDTLSENIVPSRNRGRKRAAEKVVENPSPQETESHKAEVKDIKSTDAELQNISLLSSTNQEEENVANVEQLSTAAPPQKRGRRAVIKTDPSTLVRKPGLDSTTENKNEQNDASLHIVPGGCEQTVQPQPQHAQDDESAVPELKIISLLDSTNQEEIVENSSDVEEISTPVPSKSRGRRAAVKREATATAPLIATPGRRGGRRKAAEMPTSNAEKLDSVTDNEHEHPQQGTKNQKEENKGLKPNLETNSQLDSAYPEENVKCISDVEVISTPVASKKRGRRALAKIDPTEPVTLIATPVRRAGRRKIEELPPLNAQNRLDSPTGNESEDKVPLTSEPRHLAIESSTPIGRTEVSVSAPVLPKIQGRRAGQKVVETVDHNDISSLVQEHTDVIQPAIDGDDSIIDSILVKSEPRSVETTPLAEKRNQKRAARKDEGSEQQVVPKKRNHKALIKQETESLSEISAKEEEISSAKQVDTSQEYSPMTKRNRKIPAKLTEFIVFNLVKSPKAQTPTGLTKHGQIATPKVEQLESTQEILTPIRKRGRPAKTNKDKIQSTPDCLTPIPKRGRRAFVEHDHHDNSTPLLGRTKEEPVETLIRDPQKDDGKSEKVSGIEINSLQNTSVPQKKSTRRNKGISAPNSSLPVLEDQSVQVETKTQSKPTRGRGKGVMKNDSTLESSRSIEESQPVAEKELQNIDAIGDLSAASLSLPVAEEQTNLVKESTQNKPTRGRGRAVQKKDSRLESSQDTVEIRSEAEKTQPVAEDESKKKSLRRGRAVSEEQTSEVAQTKPTRGRGRPATKIEVTLESSLPTEESQTAAEKESQKTDAVIDLSAASVLLPVPEEQTNQVKESVQNKPTRGRGRAVPKINSTLESSQGTVELQSEAEETQPAAEDEYKKKPVRRGRAVSEEQTSEVAQTKPTRGRGRAVTKIDVTVESSLPTKESQPAAENESQNIGADKDLSTANLSLPVLDEQSTQAKGRAQNKSARGRGKAVAKNDSTLESSRSTEEEQHVANEAQPVAEEAQPAAEDEYKKKPVRRGRAASEEQTYDVAQTKPTRGRGRAVTKIDVTVESSLPTEEAQPAPENESQNIGADKDLSTGNLSLPVLDEQSTQAKGRAQNKSARGRGKAVAKNDSTLESSRSTEEEQHIAKEAQPATNDETQKKTTRRGKAVLTTNPSIPAPEEQPNQVEVKTQNKPTRGRGKALSSIDSTQESTNPQLEETQSAAATKPKSTRSRKAVVNADTSPQKEAIQAKSSTPDQNSKTLLETTQNEDEDKVDKKPKRGRKVVADDNHIEIAVTTETSPVTMKPTRGGRKAATSNVAKESDDQLKKPAHKLPRSGKVQDKITKQAPKRHILEIPTNDDQQDTPTKRVRRKPIKLL